MVTYKIIKNKDSEIVGVNCSDGWSIPMNPDNTDYQAYLAWVAEGGVVLPADEIAQ